MRYDHQAMEQKWQKYWESEKIFQTNITTEKEKYYILDMFPYPSGAGLHVGHPKGYTATDVIARMKRMQGYEVLHPIGWDAFGLPAEQYALKTGNHPEEFTTLNIANFRAQIKSLGFSYDFTREVNTTAEDYYKFTQWIFLQLFKHGLAYMDEVVVNWCPELGTVLANEEVINGVSERGGYPVERKPMRQWVLKITAYAERLLEDLEELDWPKSVKDMQRNWIGRSEGTEINFAVANHAGAVISVFTTRADTLFGVTYCVLAPEHELVAKITSLEHRQQVEQYVKVVKQKSDLERTSLNSGKTGVFTGAYAVHPVTKQKVPIWIGDYVLPNYGSGAVMAVPAHDERDFVFARTYKLPIIEVVSGGNIQNGAYTGDGEHINSDFLNGLNQAQAINAINEWLQTYRKGRQKITYRLRDWNFSRQRYWGEPIPIIHWEDGTMSAVPEEELPLTLPKTMHIQPSGTGESPLANCDEWLYVIDECTGKRGRRDTNTMPQWAGSCWYFLRYIDPQNKDILAEMSKLEKWLPVDLYVGGAEHAVLHLLYARFWHKFLYDIGLVPTKEPFKKLFNQGMILGANNEKMSKSTGNVVNPDDIIKSHGADTLRLYLMFMGPLDASIAWSESGLDGARRFLERIVRLFVSEGERQLNPCVVINGVVPALVERCYHETIKKVSYDYEHLHFNTAIAQLMILLNEFYKLEQIPHIMVTNYVLLLAPLCPHLAEELWSILGNERSLSYATWPSYEEEKLIKAEMEIIVQVNGKMRGKVIVENGATKAEIETKALVQKRVQAQILNKEVKKIIYIPGKLLNIVI